MKPNTRLRIKALILDFVTAMLLLPALAMAQTANVDPSLRLANKQTIGITGGAFNGPPEYIPGGSAAEQQSSPLSAVSGTFKNLFINEFGIPLSGTSFVYTWRINGVSTGITCTIVSPAVSCSDLTHSAPILAGQYYDLQVIGTSVSPIGVGVTGGIELDTP
jgi:hypothetical protein